MRKLLFTIALLSSFAAAQAQTEVKINPLGLLFKSPEVSAEFAVSNNIGVEPTLGVSFFSLKLGEETLKSTGVSYGLQGKYYFSDDNAISKFYAGIYTRGGNSTFTSSLDNDKVKNTRFGAGLSLGYKWVSKQNVVFELGAGVGKKFINKFEAASGETDIASIPLLNIDGFFRFSVGYRFGGK